MDGGKSHQLFGIRSIAVLWWSWHIYLLGKSEKILCLFFSSICSLMCECRSDTSSNLQNQSRRIPAVWGTFLLFHLMYIFPHAAFSITSSFLLYVISLMLLSGSISQKSEISLWHPCFTWIHDKKKKNIHNAEKLHKQMCEKSVISAENVCWGIKNVA